MGTRLLWLAGALLLCAAPLAALELPDAAEQADLTPLELIDPLPARQVRAAQAGEPLVGLLAVTAGECRDGDVPAGSYFRMVQPGGNPDSGPFVGNGDSPCSDGSATPLAPGTDGGVLTTGHQPHPRPAFDGRGHGSNDRILTPAAFFGTRFAVATQSPDPQTSLDTSTVQVFHDGAGNLSGQTSAFGVAWNTQHFNQGAPKPDGSTPGITTDGVSGTYDPATGAFAISWVSTISGGPFNNFSGVWHLEGTFEPAAASAPAAALSTTRPTATAPAAPAAPTAQTGRAPTGQTLADTGPALPAALPILLLLAALAARAAATRR